MKEFKKIAEVEFHYLGRPPHYGNPQDLLRSKSREDASQNLKNITFKVNHIDKSFPVGYFLNLNLNPQNAYPKNEEDFFFVKTMCFLNAVFKNTIPHSHISLFSDLEIFSDTEALMKNRSVSVNDESIFLEDKNRKIEVKIEENLYKISFFLKDKGFLERYLGEKISLKNSTSKRLDFFPRSQLKKRKIEIYFKGGENYLLPLIKIKDKNVIRRLARALGRKESEVGIMKLLDLLKVESDLKLNLPKTQTDMNREIEKSKKESFSLKKDEAKESQFILQNPYFFEMYMDGECEVYEFSYSNGVQSQINSIQFKYLWMGESCKEGHFELNFKARKYFPVTFLFEQVLYKRNLSKMLFRHTSNSRALAFLGYLIDQHLRGKEIVKLNAFGRELFGSKKFRPGLSKKEMKGVDGKNEIHKNRDSSAGNLMPDLLGKSRSNLGPFICEGEGQDEYYIECFLSFKTFDLNRKTLNILSKSPDYKSFLKSLKESDIKNFTSQSHPIHEGNDLTWKVLVTAIERDIDKILLKSENK